MFLKTAVVTGVVRGLKRSLHVSLTSGFALAQVGEFSFVLAALGQPLGLLSRDGYQVFLGASVLSMLATPFVVARGQQVAERIGRLLGRVPLAAARGDEALTQKLADHVIVVGYGLNGRNLARVLKSVGIPYVILEQNGQVVRQARLNREPILFGDATRHEVLEKVGIGRARAIVFAISAPAEERRGVAMARHANPAIWILVRTRYVSEIEELERMGADQVIPEEFETSLEIFSRVLRLYGVPSNGIRREVEAVRGEHYETLRGLAIPTLKLDALKHIGVQAGLESVEVEDGAAAVGQNPTSLAVRKATGCTVLAAVREGKVLYEPDPDFRFQPGDIVVIVGMAEALERGLALFRKPTARKSGALRVTGVFRRETS
jgi:CPA2 family monovalent cation:H+ antiporter-2